MNPKELQKVIQTVRRNVRCPHCGRQYGFEDIHVQSFSGNVYFLELDCRNHAPILASVVVNGKQAPQITTTGAISINDVIDAYEVIREAKTLKDIIGKVKIDK